MATIAAEEQTEIDEANASGKTPIVFIHGLWLLPSSWIGGQRSSPTPATRR